MLKNNFQKIWTILPCLIRRMNQKTFHFWLNCHLENIFSHEIVISWYFLKITVSPSLSVYCHIFSPVYCLSWRWYLENFSHQTYSRLKEKAHFKLLKIVMMMLKTVIVNIFYLIHQVFCQETEETIDQDEVGESFFNNMDFQVNG